MKRRAAEGGRSARKPSTMTFSEVNNPAAASRMVEDFKRSFSSKVCLHPQKDCSGGIVSAHTLSTSLMLRPLSRNGMVYSIKANFYAKPGEWPLQLSLRGVSETSVFNGFCAKHDKSLFSAIEDKPFICSPEQLFIFAYRAVAKESYLKRKQAEGFPTLQQIKDIHGISEEIAYSEDSLILQAGSLRGAIEIENLKSRLDSQLISMDYSRFVTTVFEFQLPVPLSASFVYSPDFDFAGNYLQDFEDYNADLSHLIVTLFPTTSGGFLLLSYEDTSNSAPKRMVASLMAQKDLCSSIVWLIACQTENYAISPNWYESLTETQRHLFFHYNMINVNPFTGTVNNLRNCTIAFDDWKHKHTFTI